MSGSIWQLEEFEPIKPAWDKRIGKLGLMRQYYTGEIYRNVRNIPMLGPRLYKHTKPLYLPLARAVDVDVGIIPGSWSLSPQSTEEQFAAQKTLFAMSRWIIEGPLYVHFAAQYGITGLKVSDLREEGEIHLQPYDPTTFILVSDYQYDLSPQKAIIVESRGEGDEAFEYAEVITSEEVRTYKDGDPFGFDGREPVYPNANEFVPMVEVPFLHTGGAWGEPTFEKVIPVLDEANQLASYLAKIIKDHAEAQWAVIGAEPGDLEKSGANVWFIPDAGGDVKAITAAIDVSGVLDFIREIAAEVKGSLPELSFEELRKKDQIATATLELQLMELVLKVNRVRPNLDYGLVAGMQMAGLMAGSMDLPSISPLADEELALDAERPIIPLDPQTKIAIEMQELALEQERAMLIGEGLNVEEPEGPEV